MSRWSSLLLLCLLLASCQATQAPVVTLAERERLAWPSSVDEACAYLALVGDPKLTQELAQTAEVDLRRRQAALLFYIRKRFGLDRGNAALLAATGKSDPEEAAFVILRAKWRRTRTAVGDPANR